MEKIMKFDARKSENKSENRKINKTIQLLCMPMDE